MYELKTRENDDSVTAFLDQIENPIKREDAYRLLDIFTEATGYPAKMWGAGIIGFGSYHYKYKSGHQGDWMLAGFSPRKANISLYFAPAFPERDMLLMRLGKHKAGKGCVYINKLTDIDVDVLKSLIRHSVAHLQATYPGA